MNEFFVNHNYSLIIDSTYHMDFIKRKVLPDQLALHQNLDGYILNVDWENISEVTGDEMTRIETIIEVGKILRKHLNSLLLIVKNNFGKFRKLFNVLF